MDLEKLVAKRQCEKSHLFFTRYFFKPREGQKFRLNWHHYYLSDELEKIITGETKNLLINIAPGSGKTEVVVINFIARCLALNPQSRFLHLSYSDDLATLNSQKARDIIQSVEYQELWPLKIANDTKAKKRWNITDDTGKNLGGVYATSLGGQVTGFRAGYMTDNFSGCLIIDDPQKVEDAYSKTKTMLANRRLLSTAKSRRANPNTPIVVIMQRVSEGDVSSFILSGGLQIPFKHISIPAIIDEDYVLHKVPDKYWGLIDASKRDDKGRFSFWEYKEPIEDLVRMEQGKGTDAAGNSVAKHVFSSQYQQNPTKIGGNIIKSEYLTRYTELPAIVFRNIYADTAQKTAERNDYSVFQCWGKGVDGRIYLLDQIRGKFEAPELLNKARAFWAKHEALNGEKFGQLRQFKPEDKSSGTGLIQQLRQGEPQRGIKAIPVPKEPMKRTTDKLTRVMDVLPFLEMGLVCIPLETPWISDYIQECEAFTADNSHAHDDQIDPMCDAIKDMLANNSNLSIWEALADD
jgi:predicted phage terminase large subunit-like protein